MSTRLRELRIDDGDGWVHVLREYSRGHFHHTIIKPAGEGVSAGETWLSEEEVAYFESQIRTQPRLFA